jgi:hypothetical protein
LQTWRLCGGSVRGRSHELVGLPCQDAAGWLVTPEVTCLAVADGAGSARLGDLGSRSAIGAVLAWSQQATKLEGAEGLLLARQHLLGLADDLGCSARQLATTLALVVIHDGTVEIAQVGDCLTFVRQTDATVSCVSPPPHFEYANEVRFLTDPDLSADDIRVASFDSSLCEGVAVSSDGLKYKILDDIHASTPYAPFFRDAFEFASRPDATDAAIEAFLNGIENDQTGDDKTLLLASAALVEVGQEPAPLSDYRVLGAAASVIDRETEPAADP